MTDDIVTRLREKYAGQLPICSEAADEIERLRKQMRDMWELIDLSGECWNSHDCELCQGKARAVRGE